MAAEIFYVRTMEFVFYMTKPHVVYVRTDFSETLVAVSNKLPKVALIVELSTRFTITSGLSCCLIFSLMADRK